jgi:hypothetical protein
VLPTPIHGQGDEVKRPARTDAVARSGGVALEADGDFVGLANFGGGRRRPPNTSKGRVDDPDECIAVEEGFAPDRIEIGERLGGDGFLNGFP